MTKNGESRLPRDKNIRKKTQNKNMGNVTTPGTSCITDNVTLTQELHDRT